MRISVLAALMLPALAMPLAGCPSTLQTAGKAMVQGTGYAKLCGLGGGHYNAAPNGSCPDFLAAKGD